jgi:hypothetical protein
VLGEGGLWASNGAAATTRLVKELPLAYDDELGHSLGDRLLFFLRSSDEPDELWVSDGTTAGTQPVGIRLTYSDEETAASLDGILYFGAVSEEDLETDGPSSCGILPPEFLWRSDGTAAGTYDVDPTQAYCIDEMVAVGHSVFFSAVGGDYGKELWRYVP